MKLKFGAVVILYNPTKQQIDNLIAYREIFDTLFIFDNSDLKEYKHLNFNEYENVIYISENRNMGLPYAFNRIISDERCKKLDFLCTLDQDSIYYKTEILKLISKIKCIPNTDNYGIFSPYINYGEKKIEKSEKLINKKWVITSGSFINLKKMYDNNIFFDENYFIDRCDADLCMQFLKNDCAICVYMNSILHQQLGEGNNRTHSNHSVTRHYYIFRNRFYFNNKWFNSPKKQIYNFFQTIKHILLIIIYEENKYNKIIVLKKAFSDYKNNRMGKIDSLI